MTIRINPDIQKYLLKKAEDIGDENLIDLLSLPNLTKTELDKIKKKFKINNYGIFFSKIVPDDEDDLNKFRTSAKPSLWVQSQIQRVLDSRDTHIEILQSLNEDLVDYQGTPLFPSGISINIDPKKIAIKIRAIFDEQFKVSNIQSATNFFNNIALFIENNGILVFSTTPNTHENHFSGCAISKPIYPLILVHGASPARENFTLLHELGHLLLNSNRNEIDFRLQDYLYETTESSKEERWCNSFAAHFLLNNRFSKTDVMDYSSVEKIGKQNYASTPAVIFHLYNEKIISKDQKDYFLSTYNRITSSRNNSGGRPSPYQNLLSNSISNSQLLLYAQQNAVIDKRTLYQTWAGNVYAIPKVFQQLVERSYL